ncbi:MAG: neutral/alkaline non-lysosomal ceramidase N-terminal domain-containing protein [Cyclobacteriaceae bacterium]
MIIKFHPYLIYFGILSFNLSFFSQTQAQNVLPGWKAGVSRVDITPENAMWMAGYAGRTAPSNGTLHELWAKALVLEDSQDNQVVMITADLSGMPKSMTDRIKGRLENQFSLSAAQVMLNFSHTHSGPVVKDYLYHIYPLDNKEIEKINHYSTILENKIIKIVEEAMALLKPAKVFSENGVTRFQVNRRNNQETNILDINDLAGPNDYAVPVLKVEDMEGKMMAIAFGYACHPTVLSINQWSGDYPGFAQLEIEKMYPGATALFFQGAGGDQNPLPRRTVSLAQQYGKELASAVERVLHEEMRPLSPSIEMAYQEVDLPLNEPPSKETLSKMIRESTGHYLSWAKMMEAQLENGQAIRSYPFPIQIWKLGEQLLVGLGGEPVIEYSIKLKRQYGRDLFVLGYSNDVMAYIPTRTVLNEGGYEGATSQMAFGLPSTWKPNIETLIFTEINDMMADFEK